MPTPFIQFEGITKTFVGVTALENVGFTIRRGECHAVMGENGAGKSTLGKILAGIHRPDSGTIHIDAEPRRFHSPADALRAGIGMVHQELAFCPDLSIAENLAMGRYPTRAGLWLDRRRMHERAWEWLAQIGVEIDVRRPMRSLSTGQEQMVQIASAVGAGARFLVFDEPTSSLSEPESQQLFTLIEDLKKRGVTMMYVSHRMPEVFRLCDRVTVLRDGRYVGTLDRAEAAPDRVVEMMIGRPLEAYYPSHLRSAVGATRLRVKGLSSPGLFEGISFELRAGEIVGLAGLVGSGRSELARAIFGLDRAASGGVEVDGEKLPTGDVRLAMRRGIAMVPEDRKRQGIVPAMGCRANFSLAILDRLRRMGLLDQGRERDEASGYFNELNVRTPSLDTPIVSLSGGNQQKVVLARWLARKPAVLIVDEPTRGVDVGAKAAIHALLDALAVKGTAILLISSELPELLNLSTRLLVMRAGRLVDELPREQATQDRVLRAMAAVAASSV
ncbi:MAG: sugar ABC transporter ATP-binding protein [Planctomycetes bacterium]|nr:sugar ABC transporter ATP-binding protein [Planctomycetota bacterium]